ncbi:extensin family protein [Microvirga sesbaniae]|uniref:extensin family protein n=1 Tax=Microvirga sesbaniae TaxID=681392 RepID=UPI0021C739C4|nr:extensin family protein [Microvirga sp. HBU67692]
MPSTLQGSCWRIDSRSPCGPTRASDVKSGSTFGIDSDAQVFERRTVRREKPDPHFRTVCSIGGHSRRSAFLRALRDGACEVFDVVLSPDSSEVHHDHLHVDMGSHRARR